MLALIRNDSNEVELREVSAPVVTQPDQVLVRVKCAAVCTTDLAIVSGAFGGTTPRVLGHEVAGEVVEVGPGVEKLAVGDRVALQPTVWCKRCPPCRKGNLHLCPNRQFVGLDVDGGFAEKIVVPEENLIQVPESIPFRHACLVEPLACVFHAVDRFGGMPPRGAVITGAGISAFLFAQVLISRGLSADRILVTGRRKRRLEIIRDLGVHIVDVRSESLTERAGEVFGEAGPDILVDQTGYPPLLREAMDIIARQGTLFIYDFVGSEIPFHFGVMQLREITIRTSTGSPDTMATALSAMQDGAVDLEPTITHVYAPDQMVEAFEMLRTKDPMHVKSMIDFSPAAGRSLGV